MKKNLKLYVWEDVLTDYTSGIMFALAESVDHARKIIRNNNGGYNLPELNNKPKVVTKPEGFIVWGGE